MAEFNHQASEMDQAYPHGARERIAEVYAEALFKVAQRRGQSDAVNQELRSLIYDVLAPHPILEQLLTTAVIKRHQRREMLEQVFGHGRASDLLLDFLRVVNEHDRLNTLRAIQFEYERMVDEHGGRTRVRVRTATELTDVQRQRLVDLLRTHMQREPVLVVRVEPDLLGGMIVQIGDLVYDSSIRRRLNNLRDQLLARSNHVIQSERNRLRTNGGN